MYYITSKHTFFDYLNSNEFVIGKGSIQEITTDRNYFEDMLEICYFCITKREYSEITDFIEKRGISNKVLEVALKNNFITSECIDFQDKYSRNSLYFSMLGYNSEELNKNIFSSHVLVIGAGGIGNITSYFLNSIGIKKITIIDDDIIEESNLNRQFLFRENDIDEYKVDVIKREIQKINSNCEIMVIKEKVNKNNICSVKDVDLVICSADDEYCVDLVNEYCCSQKIPLINVGYLNDISIIGPFYIPKLDDSCCLCCDKSIYLDNNIVDYRVDAIKNNNKAPSTVVNNFFAGAMLSSELIKLFAKDYDSIQSVNAVIGIYNKNFKLEKIELVKNKHCSFCGDHSDA